MRSKFLVAVPFLVLLVAAPSGAATTEVSITPDRLGPLKIAETTLEEAKAHLGEPTNVRHLGRGCWDGMKRLSWGPDLKILFVRSEDHHVVQMPKVSAKDLDVAAGDRWRVSTGRELQVGDSERRLLDLYPRAKSRGGRSYTLIVKDGYKYLSARLDQADRVAWISAAESC